VGGTSAEATLKAVKLASAGVLDCLGWAMDWNLNFTLEAALLQEMVKEGKTGGRRARVSAGPVTASARRFCRSQPREGAAVASWWLVSTPAQLPSLRWARQVLSSRPIAHKR